MGLGLDLRSLPPPNLPLEVDDAVDWCELRLLSFLSIFLLLLCATSDAAFIAAIFIEGVDIDIDIEAEEDEEEEDVAGELERELERDTAARAAALAAVAAIAADAAAAAASLTASTPRSNMDCGESSKGKRSAAP